MPESRPVGRSAMSSLTKNGDRTVHAWTDSGVQIVRYDRAGKWYVECDGTRGPITLKQAVQLAIDAHLNNVGVILWKLPGGKAFDAAARRALEDSPPHAEGEEG